MDSQPAKIDATHCPQENCQGVQPHVTWGMKDLCCGSSNSAPIPAFLPREMAFAVRTQNV